MYVRDPLESLSADGTITTGVDRRRVPAPFEPLIASLTSLFDESVALYLYGSVATGQAVVGASDVDLIAYGVDPRAAAQLSTRLSEDNRALTRGVAIGVLAAQDLDSGDAGYGNRVFLKHYCAWLGGPDPAADLPTYPGDRAAARGFNGDLPLRVASWRQQCAHIADGDERLALLSRAIGRKTLFAVAGLVSVRDGVWTTDRRVAAHRWAEIHPDLRSDLKQLLEWGDGQLSPDRHELQDLLDGAVTQIALQFADQIGAWRAQ